jgi:hypothetical protein
MDLCGLGPFGSFELEVLARVSPLSVRVVVIVTEMSTKHSDFQSLSFTLRGPIG